MICIKQYGDHKTGTNYLCRLVRANWPGEVFIAPNTFGWKHGVYQEPEVWLAAMKHRGKVVEWLKQFLGKLKYTVQIRDPYTWFSRRLLSRKYTTKRGLTPQDVVGIFNMNYTSWRELLLAEAGNSLLIRFEELIREPAAVLQALCRQLDLPEKTEWQPVTEYIRAGGKVRMADFNARKKELLSGNRLLGCTEGQRRILDTTVDWGLMAWYGYEPVPPEAKEE